MKLYHDLTGWQVPGQQSKKALRVDVPGSPAELAAWLNERGVYPVAGFAPGALHPPQLADQPGTDPLQRSHDAALERLRAQAVAQCPKCNGQVANLAAMLERETADAIAAHIATALPGRVDEIFLALATRYHQATKEQRK